MTGCSAFGCTNREGKYSPNVSFHRFPKDEPRRTEWIKAVRRRNWAPSQRSILCSIHFEDKLFDRSMTRVLLAKTAVPTIFPAFPKHLQKEVVDKSKKEDIVVSDSIEEFNEIKSNISFLTNGHISSFNSVETEQNLDCAENNMLPILKEEEVDSEVTSDTDEMMNSVTENKSIEKLKLKVDKLTELYIKSQKQLEECQKQCKLFEKENVSLREVVSSLKQIISVSNEKFFEVES